MTGCKSLTPDSMTLSTGTILPGVSFRWDMEDDYEEDFDNLLDFVDKNRHKSRKDLEEGLKNLKKD